MGEEKGADDTQKAMTRAVRIARFEQEAQAAAIKVFNDAGAGEIAKHEAMKVLFPNTTPERPVR